MSLRQGKDLVTPADLQSMRTKPSAHEDELRARAIVCVYNNLGNSPETLEIMQMLGLIDGQCEYVAADEITSHTNNPKRRGIGHWLS